MPATPLTAVERAPGATGRARASVVLSTGVCLPEAVISNADLERVVRTSDAWILERTGIRERRRSGAGVTTSMLAAAAGKTALDHAGLESVDAIIVATSSPDTFIPPVACLVQRRLEMASVPAFDVNAACSGFVDGLIVADGLIRAGTASTVLLIGAEALTKLVDYTDRSTCVLFGDGAGAMVLGAGDAGGILASRWGSDGSHADLIYYGPSEEYPDTGDGLRLAGKGTFRMAVEQMTELCAELCEAAGWTMDDIDVVIPHQANQRIIEAVAKRGGLSLDRFVINVDRLGNTGAASVPLAFAEAEATGRLHPGSRVLSVAFGAGATWGGFAMEWTSSPR
ncbi:MAG: ketoacyl-ACP synthase III [Candidatus Dormibacteraeota bacterium]|nr:ketoacyl-ACP synthase III [Candidatus Dormibacteraeota bacterium]